MEELWGKEEKQAEIQTCLAPGQLVCPSSLSFPPWGTSRGQKLALIRSNLLIMRKAPKPPCRKAAWASCLLPPTLAMVPVLSLQLPASVSLICKGEILILCHCYSMMTLNQCCI